MALTKFPVAPAGAQRPGPVAPKPDLEFEELDPAKTMPSVVICGPSGGGKTTALERLLACGAYNCLLLNVENKTGRLGLYRPPTITIAKPVMGPNGQLRKSTPQEQYDRLMRFAEGIALGKYRSHPKFVAGRRMVLLCDGLMAVGKIIHRYKVAQHSRKDSFIMWGEIFDSVMAWVGDLKDASSEAASSFGFDPIGLATTLGTSKIIDTKTGTVTGNEYILPGKATGKELAFAFEMVIFAHARKIENNETAFVYQMKLGEEWEAKSPPIFDSEIAGVPPNGPDFAEVYAKAVEYYQNPQVAE